VLDRLLVAVAPVLVIVTISFLFIPRPAIALGVVGGFLALVVAALSRDRAGALVGGLAIGLPLALIAFIAFLIECEGGGNYCN
jgi:hypothetical protein